VPTYVLKCAEDTCGERFEENVAMSERGSVCCKRCGGPTKIVPQSFSWGWPAWANPNKAVPTRAEARETSGLLVQGERDGW